MKNNGGNNFSKYEKQRNTITSYAIGAALGVVFWSALDGLLPVPFDFLMGMATGLLIGFSFDKRPSIWMHYPTFIVRRLLLSFTACMLGVFAYLYLLDQNLQNIHRILSSLLAIIPSIVLMFTIGTAIAHLDGIQRRIQTEAIVFAFGGTAIFVVGYIFLGWAGVPSPNWSWLVVIMAFTWMLGKLWTMWRYR